MKMNKHILIDSNDNVFHFGYEIFTDYEALEIFKEAKGTIRKLKTQYQKELNDILHSQREIRNQVFKMTKKLSTIEFTQDLAVTLHTDTARQIFLEERISYFNKILKRKVTQPTFSIDDIKQIPITNYIDFNRAGFSRCIWHNEKTASMKYDHRRNRVYCFGCNRHGDVIDVVQELYNLQAVGDAIRFLKK